LREDIGEAQRAMVAAPDMPLDRVDYLRSVFTEVLTDPVVVDEGAKTNREIEYLSGADLQRLVSDLMASVGPRLPEFHKIVLDTYF
jgi:tripartite-type tricarboxylate transporter receptor subunit TctC